MSNNTYLLGKGRKRSDLAETFKLIVEKVNDGERVMVISSKQIPESLLYLLQEIGRPIKVTYNYQPQLIYPVNFIIECPKLVTKKWHEDF